MGGAGVEKLQMPSMILYRTPKICDWLHITGVSAIFATHFFDAYKLNRQL